MRQSDRAAATRGAILGAAREVFAVAGFTEASIAEVVSRAGASVGSLYHHFGGKADLYLALFEDFQQRMEERAASAVTRARELGETSPSALFVEGSRSYLLGCWEERELARLFLAGGGPAGFELVARRRYREWARLNAALLSGFDDDAGTSAEVLVLVLTAVVSEAGQQVAIRESEEDARRLAGEVLALIARVAEPRVDA